MLKYSATLESAKAYAEAEKLDAWIHLYLNEEGRNIPFSDGLKKCAPMFVEYTGGEFVLNDGNHRLQAYKDLGYEKAWVLFWITEEDEYQDFLKKYGEYVKDCVVIRK